MTNSEGCFEWAHRVECPQSVCTESIERSLTRGISGFLWDQLSRAVHTSKEVIEVRKNILLYKLKNGEEDAAFRYIQNIAQLKLSRSQLNPQIENLEKKWDDAEFAARQRQQKLLKVKSMIRSTKTKEDLLRIKKDQLRSQMKDCEAMRLVCQHIMPATSCEIDVNVIDESLSLLNAVSTRDDRQAVFNKISENVSSMQTSILWNILLSRTRDLDEIMRLGTEEIVDTEKKRIAIMDIGIGRACGQHIASLAQIRKHRAKIEKHETLAMEYIEKIEASVMNNIDVSEWLLLTLEVRKLETQEKYLQLEVDTLKKTVNDQSYLANELSIIESDFHSIDLKCEVCMQGVQKALTVAKHVQLMIGRIREKLLIELKKIATLRSDDVDVNYLDTDLSAELHVFHDVLQLEALRKIVLKGNVAAYRHTKTCMSEALLATTAPSLSNQKSQFPMIQAPIYHLMQCYKNVLINSWLTKLENEVNEEEECIDLSEWISSNLPDVCRDAHEILNLTDSTCDKIREGISQFHSLFDAWSKQTVQQAMISDDRVVNGATYKAWVKRYSTLYHMIQRTKQ